MPCPAGSLVVMLLDTVGTAKGCSGLRDPSVTCIRIYYVEEVLIEIFLLASHHFFSLYSFYQQSYAFWDGQPGILGMAYSTFHFQDIHLASVNFGFNE